MLLLLSGEGATDMGSCNNAMGACSADDYKPGAMAYIVDQLVNWHHQQQGFAIQYIANGLVHFVSEKYLSEHKPKAKPKSIKIPGKRRPKETQYFFANAHALAIEAKRLSEEADDKVLAVLFRDSDGTVSSGRGEWQAKRESMIKGFEAADYKLGVAMMPKPKSEAWLICALKNNPYQACATLEDRSGNDDSPNALKTEFNSLISNHPTSLTVNELVEQSHIDANRIDMKSMNAFKADLKRAVESIFP